MSVETALHAAIKDLAPTYPNVADQNAPRPRLTYQRVAGVDSASYDADGKGATQVRIQVDAWADDYPSARRLSDLARAACYAGLTVGQITDNPSDFEADTKLHRASFDVEAWE